MGAPSNENLSLGKLRRAVDGNNSYTDISKLGEVCAGTTSANANVSMSDFYISAVAAPTGYAFVDEQTAETYTLQFSERYFHLDQVKIILQYTQLVRYQM